MYLGIPTRDARPAMTARRIACMTTPAQGNILPERAFYGADNGKFSEKGWPGHAKWFAFLEKTAARYGTELCLWATAPDVVCDAPATLDESLPWLPRIRGLGLPAAFVAQDGSEDGLIPWGEFDVLFLGGSDAWKLGAGARLVTREAKRRGMWVHMGRVNSRQRLRYADLIGCDSVDGTLLRWGHLDTILEWIDELNREIPLLLDVA